MTPLSTGHYTWHIRAISVPSLDTDLTLYVAFDNARFLFGCGEGTQRCLVQKRSGCKWLEGIFISDGGSKGRGGLAGLALTAADAGVTKLNIIGPPDITQSIATLRSSVARTVLTVETHSPSSSSSSSTLQPIYSSSTMNVKAIVLKPPPKSEVSPDGPISTFADLDLSAPDFRISNLSRDKVEVWAKTVMGDMFHNAGLNTKGRNLHPAAAMPPTPNDELETDMIYICQGPPTPGKFDAKRAAELGVPNGPMRGRLVKGEAIEFQVNGEKRVVRSEDVLSGGGPGSVLIVVSCLAHNLERLLTSSGFEDYQPGKTTETVAVSTMVHRVATDIWRDPRYQSWMATFGPDTRHLIADTQTYRNDIVFSSSAWNTLKTSLLDGDIFPLPLSSTPYPLDNTLLPPNTTLMIPDTYTKLHPPTPITTLLHAERDVPFPTTLEATHEARRNMLSDNPELAKSVIAARQSVRADPRWNKQEDYPGEDITVTTLGTGSALPSKHRSVSSTYLDIPGLGGILLDAGEGTLGQLRRRFGLDGLKRIYEGLKVVFISHMHADHHLGLQAVLEDRYRQGVTTPLYLISPYAIALQMQESGAWQYGVSQEGLDNLIWINNYNGQYAPLVQTADGTGSDGEMEVKPTRENEVVLPDSEDFISGIRRWPRWDTGEHGLDVSAWHDQQLERLKRDLNLVGVRTPLMRHRGRAWGLVLEHQSGWKISYSGDTMPCSAFVRAGMGSTLMIHEATLGDDEPLLAKEKGHSTFSQAINVGKAMNARNILLTHFSQRYPKLPKLALTTPTAPPSSAHASSPSFPEQVEPDVSISFDMMSIKIGQIWRMKHYHEAMELMFPPEEEVEEEGDMVVQGVRGDVNPTLLGGGVGAGVGGNRGDGGKKGRKDRGSGVRGAYGLGGGGKGGSKGMGDGKRGVSPSSGDSESKRLRGFGL